MIDKIRCVYNDAHWLHQDLLVRDNGVETRYCGDRYCPGKCGLPALVIPADGDGPEVVARGDAGAVCLVFEPRSTWAGERVTVPEPECAKWRKVYWW